MSGRWIKKGLRARTVQWARTGDEVRTGLSEQSPETGESESQEDPEK